MKSTGYATWKGPWKTGSGTLSTACKTLSDMPYTFASRFEGSAGASPEELVATALAGCFNQALANNFGMIGFEAEAVQTTVVVGLGYGSDTYPSIFSVAISTQVSVLGIAKERFDYCAERARSHCTIARLLNIEPTMEAELLNQ